jgi:hypothetical protein
VAEQDAIWHVIIDDEQRGPLSRDQILEYLHDGQLVGSDLIWRPGFSDWKSLNEVTGFWQPPPLRPRSLVTPHRENPLPAATETTEEVALDDTVARYQKQFRDDKSLLEGRETVARYQQQFQVAKLPQSGPTGLGGWLVLLGIGLFFGPLKLFLSIVKGWASVDANAVQQFPVAMRGALAIEIAFLLYYLCTTTLFFLCSRRFPRFFIWLLIAAIFEQLVIIAWLKLNLPSNFDITSVFGSEEFAQLVVGVIGALLWIPYILKSKRVANTFVD